MTLTVLTDSTINFDQVSFLSEPAIAYGKAGLTVTVNANILVDAIVDNAIFSDQSGSILINNGTIFSGGPNGGVDFVSTGGSITNNAGATIAANSTGIL